MPFLILRTLRVDGVTTFVSANVHSHPATISAWVELQITLIALRSLACTPSAFGSFKFGLVPERVAIQSAFAPISIISLCVFGQFLPNSSW